MAGLPPPLDPLVCMKMTTNERLFGFLAHFGMIKWRPRGLREVISGLQTSHHRGQNTQPAAVDQNAPPDDQIYTEHTPTHRQLQP